MTSSSDPHPSPRLVFTGLLTAQDSTRKQSPGELADLVDHLERFMAARGGSLADVAHITTFHTNTWDIERELRSIADRFAAQRPAWTAVGVSGLEDPDAGVGLRAIAHPGAAKKSIDLPGQAWLSGLPGASACLSGTLLFISGQMATGPAGDPATPADPVAQARLAYAAVGDVLKAAGAGFDDVLDFTHHLVDIRGGLPTFTDVYVPEALGNVPVARAATTTHVGATGLIRPGLIGSYQALADLTEGQREGSTPDTVWWTDFPLAAATRKPNGSVITVAGHVAARQNGDIAHPGDAVGQMRFILDGIAETMAGYGLTLADLGELTIFAKEHRHAPALRAVLRDYFTDIPPVSIVGSPGLWLEGFELEIAAMASR